MLWTLLLAHLLADYPLQPDWLIRVKRHWWGLSLHVGIHLSVMLALSITVWQAALPYLLALTGIHFFLDASKTTLADHRPRWVVVPYLLDQFLHVLSIVLVSTWAEQRTPYAFHTLGDTWLIYSIGFLFVTYVWFVSERVLNHANEAYLRELNAQAFPRMVTRAGLTAGLLWITTLVRGATLLGTALPQVPYFNGRYRRRALLSDLTAVLGTVIFILVTR
jgi:hypothetical protein